MTGNKTALVIGAGLGGLSAAITLSQNGFDVSLYEKMNTSEVNLTATNRMVSVLTSAPSLLTMPYIFERLFTQSGKTMEDYVEIEELPLQWRSLFH
ncbi:NAD(P)-binding protein [Salinicoccus sesuvii]|uniref:NAD(P)-binding protein n=1 Tax=Salinicoccus sesuvii TaxID=868281 RepID=A0ABV7NBP5_9STAP